MDQLLKNAVPELGQKEISGPQHNQTIVDYATEAGFTEVGDDETPWCSIFMNWVVKKSDLQSSNELNARSWLDIGLNVDNSPEPGDVVIFWRESPDSWKGHVGIFFGFSKDGNRIYCLGGNQGNQVSVAGYTANTLLGFRRLPSAVDIDMSETVLRHGDTGDDVKALQDNLKLADINCGTSDGIFGHATKDALKELQAMNPNLKVDGIFGKNTRIYLLELLNSTR